MYGGGMFGLNDDKTQPTASDNGAPAVIHNNNPYIDSITTNSPPADPVAPATPPALTHPEAPAPTSTSDSKPSADGNLLDIKQQVLQSLQPLVSHLDQTPEEKFKTTMMLIQATDNSSLVKEAYDAANQITDEKARAQALLDVVNEINYFTQNQKDKPANLPGVAS